MKRIIILLSMISLIVAQKPYFQQHVAYDIDVTLDDSLHTLTAYDKINLYK